MLRRVAFVRARHLVTPPYRILLLCCRCVGVLRYCRPAAVQPPSGSSSLQLYCACGCCCSRLFLWSERAISRPTIPHISAVLPLRVLCCSMSIDRANLGGNIVTFLIVINMLTHPYIQVSQRQHFYVHTRGTALCRRFCPHHRWQALDNTRAAQRYVCNPAAQQQ